MKARNCKYIILVLTILYCTQGLQAQVTIGSRGTPADGMLLQIKDQDADSENVTATKGGLVLPRVFLKAANKLEPFIKAGTEESNDFDKHIGLIVFNTNSCFYQNGEDAGLYLWNGTDWRKIGVENRIPEVEEHFDQESKLFKARRFGAAGVWMVENLSVTHYANGSLISSHDGSASTQAAYTYPNATAGNWGSAPSTWHRKQGLLYNWQAASKTYLPGQGNVDQGQIRGTAPGINEVEKDSSLPIAPSGEHYVQGVCPDNWHLPTDREWNKLEKELYENPTIYSTYKLTDLPFDATYPVWKEEWEWGTTANNPPTLGGIGYRGSTNTSKGHAVAMLSPCISSIQETDGVSLPTVKGGNNIRLVGFINGSSIHQFESYASLWTSSVSSASVSYSRGLKNGSTGINREVINHSNFISVRCVKNE